MKGKPAKGQPDTNAGLNKQLGPDQLEKLFQQVSDKVSPTAKDALEEKEFALQIAGKLEARLAKQRARIFFVGSTARDTGLAGDRDIDLFACFPTSMSREQIVDKTIGATRAAVAADWQMHYAEHPYLQAHIGRFVVEVIPCFEAVAHQPIKSAVDRSPLHMDYLQKRLNLQQKRDVRVLKALLRRAGVYGAEAKIEGFSGLLCEYLILNYRSLRNLLESASKWKPPVVIDLEGQRTLEEGGPEFVAKAYPQSSLVLIDAIDKNRNAAAAVGPASLASFISISNALLAQPSMRFFIDSQLEGRTPLPAAHLEQVLQRRKTALYLLEFPVPADLVEDTLYPQLRKALRSIIEHLTLEEFNVVGSDFFAHAGNGYYLLELAHPIRPAVKRLVGPPAWMIKDSADFIASHPPSEMLRGPFIEGERWVVEVPRNSIDAQSVIKDTLHAQKTVAVPSDIAGGIRRAKLFEGTNAIQALREKGSLPSLRLEDYLFRKAYWI
jgi:tRNA nucleotidyltransferase (CCA-adding enzyme)